MIKFLLLSLIFLIAGISCAYSEKKSSESYTQNKKIIIVAEDSISLSCKICLLKDSLEQLKLAIFRTQYTNEDPSTLEGLKVELDSKFLELKESLMDERGDFTYLDYAETLAKDECMKEYPFNDISDSVQRTQYFLKFISYSDNNFTKLPSLISDKLDTGQLEQINDYYVLKVKGENVKVKVSEIDKYWSNLLEAYSDLFNYLNYKKNEISKIISGRSQNQLSKIELLMFLEHSEKCRTDNFTLTPFEDNNKNGKVKKVGTVNHNTENIKVYINNDTIYQKLYDTFIKVNYNKH